jgi:toxin-antitoxin system PIN domain toxin
LPAIADLLDVNVWLAFSVEGHSHHASAMNSWDKLRRPTFCRVTQLGFLRLLCNRRVMGNLALDPESAWTISEHLLNTGAVDFHDEPAGLEMTLKLLTRGAKASRGFWTDAYLAAFAITAGMRLVSFDAGFNRFRDLDCFILD